MSTHFGNEAPIRPERIMYTLEYGILIKHPVKGSIREYSIEILLERQLLTATEKHVEPLALGRLNQLRGAIDSCNPCSGILNTTCERTVAAA